MASNRIKGITVEIGGDATKFLIVILDLLQIILYRRERLEIIYRVAKK